MLRRGVFIGLFVLGPTLVQACKECGNLLNLSLQELYNLEIVQMNALGAHMHPAGERMFGYHYMFMNMEGIRDGRTSVSPAQVFARHPSYTVAHVRMEMHEHMFDAMYAPTDRITLMAMLPYKRMTMLHTTPTGVMFTQRARGVGDLEIMGMFTVAGDIKQSGHRLMIDAGISLPTGSTNVEDHDRGDPTKPLVKLEYPMQLGSGTYDLLPGLTYLGDSAKWAWGVQAMATLRVGRNSRDYRLGNQYRVSGWVAYGWSDWLAPYVRIENQISNNISGRDPAYGLVPKSGEASPNKQAGERVNLLLGVNLYAPKGSLKGNRLTLEAGSAIYERLNGPQLSLDYSLKFGWTYGF